MPAASDYQLLNRVQPIIRTHPLLGAAGLERGASRWQGWVVVQQRQLWFPDIEYHLLTLLKVTRGGVYWNLPATLLV
jgi:hypothetical protein